MSDDKELPPSLDEPEAMDEYWFEKTTITVDRWCKAQLDYERDGKPWNEYLEELRQAKADPLTLNDTQEIAEQLKNELSMANEPGVEVDIEELYKRIDELEDSIPSKTAEEIEGRLR